jgi:hypothetical protein
MVQEKFGAMSPLVRVTDVPPATALTVPPQELLRFTGLARKTLAGRLSVNETCVRLVPGSLFLMMMVSWLIFPAQIVPGFKLLLTPGGKFPFTFSVALAGEVLLIVVPPPVDDSSAAGIVLMRFPTVVEVTLTETVHDPGIAPVWAGTVPPLREKEVAPATAVTVPPQVFVSPTEPAMLRPGWTLTRLSVQEASVSANPLGLKTVTLRRDTSPAAIEMGEKLLFISAGKVMT